MEVVFLDKFNFMREYNKLFDFINQEGTKEYFSGSRFIKIIKEFDSSFPDYTQYIEHRREKKLSTSRKKYFYEILSSFQEDIKEIIIKRIHEEASDVEVLITLQDKLIDKNFTKDKNNKDENIEASLKIIDKPNIFISYSWSNEDIADSLDILFKAKSIHLKRDKREIQYRHSIKEFMKTVRKSDYCLMLISDNYLKSMNCMYEISEFIKDEDYKRRILPLIHHKLDIFNIAGRTKYIKYWQDEFLKTKLLLEGLEELNKTEIIEELKRIENIQRNIGEFLSLLSDMNNILFDDKINKFDFNKIYHSMYPTTTINEQKEASYINVDLYKKGEDGHNFYSRALSISSIERVTRYIYDHDDFFRINNILIADTLDISIETLARVLKRLNKDSIIDIEEKTINKDKLQNYFS